GVNTASLTDAIGGGTIDTGDFGEASVNLSEIPGGIFNNQGCASFGSVTVKSPSSGSSTSAQLKDFIAPAPIHVSNCGSITIVKEVPGTDPQTFTFTGSGTDASVAAASPFTLADNGTTGADTKAFTDIEPGSYSFNETSIPSNWKLANPAVTCDA